jgi:hypothetical protein
MLTKLLRFPVPDQIKALLEKIDSEGAALDSSSRRKIESLIHVDNLTRYERYLLKQGLAKYERAKTLDRAMCIVLNQEDERDRAEKQIVSSTALLNGLNGTTVAMRDLAHTDPRAIYQSGSTYK